MEMHKQHIFAQVAPNFLAVAKLAWEYLGYCHFPSGIACLGLGVRPQQANVISSSTLIGMMCPVQADFSNSFTGWTIPGQSLSSFFSED